ncbi:MAG: DUF192 domain-containing protein [Armatimonadetes bacterium]|nr:DUF192 domain-containing protein [Armatimonadota bacterium]
MLARNVTRSTVLAREVRTARAFRRRLRGLMLTPALAPGAGLLIERCSGIHTCFMRFAIDAVFLDREGVVVAVVQGMRPWRFGRLYRGARRVLELPAGAAAASGTRAGDRVSFEGEGDSPV